MPTTCTASATAIATMTRNRTAMRRSETPFASASSGSSVANTSGRAIPVRNTSVSTPRTSMSHKFSGLTPRTLPNSNELAWVA